MTKPTLCLQKIALGLSAFALSLSAAAIEIVDSTSGIAVSFANRIDGTFAFTPTAASFDLVATRNATTLDPVPTPGTALLGLAFSVLDSNDGLGVQPSSIQAGSEGTLTNPFVEFIRLDVAYDSNPATPPIATLQWNRGDAFDATIAPLAPIDLGPAQSSYDFIVSLTVRITADAFESTSGGGPLAPTEGSFGYSPLLGLLDLTIESDTSGSGSGGGSGTPVPEPTTLALMGLGLLGLGTAKRRMRR
ncbi:MAG: PEP-CTERM sorting domain-containing protein [Gammaproteobacteria bacterium]|nr:PEP-CTERM sorting domain-containing protein [Gammaproteobacteria bacterium]